MGSSNFVNIHRLRVEYSTRDFEGMLMLPRSAGGLSGHPSGGFDLMNMDESQFTLRVFFLWVQGEGIRKCCIIR